MARGMSNGVAALETSPAVAQALKQSYHDPGIPCRVHPTGTKTGPRKNLNVDIYGSVIHSSPEWKQPIDPSTDGWGWGLRSIPRWNVIPP